MIGNDVVDILQSRIESNWLRPGFIQKIFTDDEQLLIANAPEPEILVWLLWSMKEAAYKIFNRQTSIRKYIPKKLECTILYNDNNYCEGQVICFDSLYYTTTIITNDSLHTVAVTCPANFNNVIEIENKLILKNEFGFPYLYDINKNVHYDVSVSHHGRFKKVVAINPA